MGVQRMKLSTVLLLGATTNAQDDSTISKDEILTEVASLKANYDMANAYVSNEANWADNEMVGLANYLKRDFWRFFEWGVAFQGTTIETWFPLLNINVESAIAANVTMEALWDEYVAIPSGNVLPQSSDIDARFFETKKGHKGPKGAQGGHKVDWGKCKEMEPTSAEFDAECGQKMKEFKKESKWDCKCKDAAVPAQSTAARQTDKPEGGKPEGGGGRPEGGKPQGSKPEGEKPEQPTGGGEGGRPKGPDGTDDKVPKEHKEGGPKGKYALADSGEWDKEKWEEWDKADYQTKFNNTDGEKPGRFFEGKDGKMVEKDCDCKPKPETRDGHGDEDSFFKGPKESKKEFEPITADEFKQKVQGKIGERAASVASCDAALVTIPDEKWTKFAGAASEDRELEMTLKLLHFCTHGGKKAKEMVDQVAEEVDDAGSANEVNDADLTARMESLERAVVCSDYDLFCNANGDSGSSNGS